MLSLRASVKGKFVDFHIKFLYKIRLDKDVLRNETSKSSQEGHEVAPRVCCRKLRWFLENKNFRKSKIFSQYFGNQVHKIGNRVLYQKKALIWKISKFDRVTLWKFPESGANHFQIFQMFLFKSRRFKKTFAAMSEKRITMSLAEKKRYAEMLEKGAKKEDVFDQYWTYQRGREEGECWEVRGFGCCCKCFGKRRRGRIGRELLDT